MLGYLNGIFESKANSKERFSSVFLFWASIAQHHHHQWARNFKQKKNQIVDTKKLVNQFHGIFFFNSSNSYGNYKIKDFFFLVKLILVWKFSSPLCITWLLKKTSYISKPASYLVDVYPWCVFQKFKFMQANSVWCHKFFIRDLISWLHNFFPLLLLTMMFWRKYLS